jgi:hypothetical protein
VYAKNMPPIQTAIPTMCRNLAMGMVLVFLVESQACGR